MPIVNYLEAEPERHQENFLILPIHASGAQSAMFEAACPS